MAAKKPTAQTPHLQPSPSRSGVAAAYVLWRLSESIKFDDDGCWEWTGARQQKGYGVIHLKNYDFPERVVAVHRLVYSICVSPVPDGLCVLHRCDNPPCCRPDHLFLGTDSDNIADKVAKGRQAVGPVVRKNHEHLKGEAVLTAKLTADDVLEIRRRFADCDRPSEIAGAFGISETHLYYIVRGESWPHLPLAYKGELRRRPCPHCGKTFTTRQGALYTHVAECRNGHAVDLVLGKE